MSKRGAEHQLTKDSAGYEDSEGEDQGSFKVANESVLASRPMKGLPKRRGGAPTAPAPTPPALTNGASEATPPKPTFAGFGGFSGFGSSSAPSTTTSAPSFGFASSTTPFAGFGSAKPPTSSPFSSLPASSAPLNPPTTTSTPFGTSTITNEPKSEKTTDSNKDSFELYKNLRGLNHSLLEQLQIATEKDPFADLTQTLSTALEAYKQYREKIQSGQPEKAIKPLQDTAKASPTEPPPKPMPLAMPLPPASGFSFGGSVAFGSSTTSTMTASKPWTFPSSLNSDKATLEKKEAGADKTTAENAKTLNPTPTPALFSFPATSKASESVLAPPPTSTTAPSLPFSLNSSTSKPFGSSTTPFTFGVPAGSSLFSSAPTSTPSSDASTPKGGFGRASGTPVSFGSAAPKTPGTGAFSFTKTSPASGSLGNPVGFSFGSPPKDTPPPPSSSTTVSTLAPAFPASLLALPTSQSSATTSRDASPLSTGTTDTAEPLADEQNPEDKEGEGEENETTLEVVRAHVYVMNREAKKWTSLGVSNCKVKHDKITTKHRILCRQEATTKVTVNFLIFSEFSAKVESNKVVAFIGHDNGQPANYKLRCGNSEEADKFLKALEDVKDRMK